MTVATICSGIGGADLGFERAGYEVIWMCEIDEHCRNILRRHFPGKPIYPDMTKLDTSAMRTPDVLHGSTPCQGFSVAGLRGSMADDRSNLCLQFCRTANELDPSILVWENVVGVLSTKDNAFGCFIAALVGADAPLVPPRAIDRWRCDEAGNEAFSWPNAGVVVGPKRTSAWRVIDSQWHGVAQRRERCFVVADTLGGCAAQILFERKSVCWNYPTREAARERIAPTLAGCSNGGGANGPGRDVDSCESLQVTEVAWALQERDSKGSDSSTKDGHLIPCRIQEIGKRQSGNSANGVGHGHPGDPMFTLQSTAQHGVCCFQSKDSGESAEDIAPTLRALNHDKSHMNGGGQLAVAFKPSHFTRGKDGAPSELAPPLSADADKGDQEPVVATSDMRPCIASRTMVRRLTPVECARLQAHPDDWAAWGLNEKGERVEQSDSAQYRQFGNGVTVNVLEWIARRITLVLQSDQVGFLTADARP